MKTLRPVIASPSIVATAFKRSFKWFNIGMALLLAVYSGLALAEISQARVGQEAIGLKMGTMLSLLTMTVFWFAVAVLLGALAYVKHLHGILVRGDATNFNALTLIQVAFWVSVAILLPAGLIVSAVSPYVSLSN